MRGADLRMEIEVELIDAVKGGARTIRVPRLRPAGAARAAARSRARRSPPAAPATAAARCGRSSNRSSALRERVDLPRCGGSGKTVDALCTRCRGEAASAATTSFRSTSPGIDDGQQLRVAAKRSRLARPSGDLYVLIRLRSTRCSARGRRPRALLRISPAQAALGADLEVPTIEGATAPVKVPGGAQHGQMVRLRERRPASRLVGRGDQLVYLDVAVPRTLTKEQKALYKQLHDLEARPNSRTRAMRAESSTASRTPWAAQ